jgi:hypothetical protein
MDLGVVGSDLLAVARTKCRQRAGTSRHHSRIDRKQAYSAVFHQITVSGTPATLFVSFVISITHQTSSLTMC